MNDFKDALSRLAESTFNLLSMSTGWWTFIGIVTAANSAAWFGAPGCDDDKKQLNRAQCYYEQPASWEWMGAPYLICQGGLGMQISLVLNTLLAAYVVYAIVNIERGEHVLDIIQFSPMWRVVFGLAAMYLGFFNSGTISALPTENTWEKTGNATCTNRSGGCGSLNCGTKENAGGNFFSRGTAISQISYYADVAMFGIGLIILVDGIFEQL